jgi:hypothetical protein
MNIRLSQWQVQIQGVQSDLEHLACHFTTTPFLVRADERAPGFLFESIAFTNCITTEEVLKVADEELLVLSGVLRLMRNSPKSLCSGAVYRENAKGGRDSFVFAHEVFQVHVEAHVSGHTVTDNQGNVLSVPPPPPRTISVSKLAWANSAVAKVMRLMAAQESQTWVGLYRIHEVVEAETGGEHALKKKSWGSPKNLKRFKHSANSVTVGGDAARHGKEQDQPPTNPMSIEEAKAYVNYVVQAWIAENGA